MRSLESSAVKAVSNLAISAVGAGAMSGTGVAVSGASVATAEFKAVGGRCWEKAAAEPKVARRVAAEIFMIEFIFNQSLLEWNFKL